MTYIRQIKFLWIMVVVLGNVWSCVPNQNRSTKKNMIHLSELSGKAHLKVGQKAYCEASVHGSVGVTASVSVENEEVLKLVNSNITYKNPEKREMSGGDAATKTFIFEAMTAGVAKVVVTKKFRGELRSTHNIVVEVANK